MKMENRASYEYCYYIIKNWNNQYPLERDLNLMKQLWITKLWLWQIQGIGSGFFASKNKKSNQSEIALADLLRPPLKYSKHLLRVLKTTAWHNCFYISQMPLAKGEEGWSQRGRSREWGGHRRKRRSYLHKEKWNSYFNNCHRSIFLKSRLKIWRAYRTLSSTAKTI